MSRTAKNRNRKHTFRSKNIGPALSAVAKVEPRSNHLFRAAFYGGLALVTLILGTNFYFFLAHGTFAFESGESYGDRLTNFAFVRGFMEYGFNYYEPFSRQNLIFYDFFFYWMEGALATLLHVEPWAMANVLHLFLGPALFLTFFQLGRTITGNRWIALVATLLTFLFGNLECLLRGELITTHSYGSEAIIYSFLRALYGPYCDNYAFLAGYGAIYFFWKIATAQDDRISKREAAFFFLLFALSSNIQLLVALLILALCAVILFARTFLDGDVPPRLLRNGGIVFGLLYLAMLVIFNFRLPMPLLAVAAVIPYGIFFWFSRQKKAHLLLLASAIPVAAVTATTLYMVSKAGGEAFRYNNRVRELDMAFPPLVYLVSYLPILALAAVAIWRSPDKRSRIYLGALGLTSLALSYNNFLGYNNHPCRFVTSSFPILCILASVGLFRLYEWKRKEARIALTIAGVLIGVGVFQNMATFTHVALTTPREISPWVAPAVEAVNKVRAKERDAVFYVWPLKVHAMNLAPYTGARFFYQYPIFADEGTQSIYNQLDTSTSLDDLLRRMWSLGVHVDYILVAGPAPTDGSGTAQSQFLFHHNGISVFKVSKNTQGPGYRETH